MKNSVFIAALLLTGTATVQAQTGNPARDAYERFRQNAVQRYENFRDKANREYADFMERAWKRYNAVPAVPIPKDDELEPMPMPKEDWNKKIKTRPITIDEIVPPVIPTPQPMPIAPIRETPSPKPDVVPDEDVIDTVVIDRLEEDTPILTPMVNMVSFQLYGTPLKVRFEESLRLSILSPTEKTLADAWRRLSSADYNGTIKDCIRLRSEYKLSDWAYLMMLDKMSEACMGKGNAATLFMAYVFCQTGYQMRLGMADGQVVMLFASDYIIYNMGCYDVGGVRFYPYKCNAAWMSIFDCKFPKEQRLSLVVSSEQAFAMRPSVERTIKSENDANMKVTVSVNRNLVDFYAEYPTSMFGENLVSRWAMYANVPMQKEVREKLYPQFREMLKGKGQLEAINKLLSFCQWGFVYKYDDEVWGGDRAFFSEETLFYPYADCEDRSILFSRLVRDLFGLKVLLVFYPGHLATAVHFTQDVPGDYITLNGLRYTICDPTYFGAPVGMSMSDMDNKSAKVILLD